MDSAVFPNRPKQKSAGWYGRVASVLFGRAGGTGALHSAADSVKGGRETNEDRTYSNDLQRFYMVADGIGGHHGGALASQIAIETIPVAMQRLINRGVQDQDILQQALREAVDESCAEMARVASGYEGYDEMGCTIAVAFVVGDQLYYSNVGDCRVYTFDGQRLFRLTHDHTMVQGLIDADVLTEAQAKTHRWRHVITNSVSAYGVNDPPWLEQVTLDPDASVLLTTDGLTDELSDNELAAALADHRPLPDLVGRLMTLALSRGASDNVSCLLAGPAI